MSRVKAWGRSRVARTVLVLSGFLAVGLGTVGGGGVAFAVCDPTTDPTCGAAESFLTAVQTWVTSHGIVIVAGLIFLGAAVTLLIKFAKKGARAV